MTKHRRSDWEELKEQLAQTEYELADARRQWDQNRNERIEAERERDQLRSRLSAIQLALGVPIT